MTDSNTRTSPLLTGRFVDPHTVSTHFHIKEGDTVADLGAGSGYFMEILAKLVGVEGTVYACEIQKDLSVKLGEIARSKGLAQVSPLWSDIEELGGSKIPDGVLDVAIMVNTFFQFEDKTGALQEVSRTLRSGGKLFIIDWSESFGGLGPQPGQVVSEQEAKALAEQQAFMYERSFDAGDHHYGLALRKL
jgi:ubiquinone/menaquinone biosynthesis C-methylase UbiE